MELFRDSFMSTEYVQILRNSRDYTLAGKCDGDTKWHISHIYISPSHKTAQGYDETYHLTLAGGMDPPSMGIVEPSCI